MVHSLTGGIIGCLIAVLIISVIPLGKWIGVTTNALYVLVSWETMLLGLAIALICSSLAVAISSIIIRNIKIVEMLKQD